jgi:nitrile hydratase subunit beta
MYVDQPATTPDEPDVPRSGELRQRGRRGSYDPDVDGIHDLGGLDGFGRVEHVDDEPMFGADWERRTFRSMLALMLGGYVSDGSFRHSIERMEPSHYLSSPYYEHWLTAAATLLVETGVTTNQELDRRAGGHVPLSQPDRGVLPEDMTSRTTPRFALGDSVRVRKRHPPGHTRAPRYVQGKHGTIARVDEAADIDDIAAHGGGSVKDPLYSVRITSRELWGEAGADDVVVHVDLFERYLQEA